MIKAHPYADLFPMMSAVELDALTEDIAANGLRQPIVRYQGLILDGRNRLLACEKAEVEPAFTDHEGDDASALALVISLNVQRRDLTQAQRAVVAARALPLFEEAATRRQEAGRKEGGKEGGRGRPKEKLVGKSSPQANAHRARDDAAKVFKVSAKSVQQAKAILDETPELAAKVEACSLSLAAAWEQLQEHREAEVQRKKDEARIAKYREAVSNGEMTFKEAMEKVLAEEREEKERLASETDARRDWLKGLVGVVEYVERYLATETDEYLAWYAEPGAPGHFDHGLTADRINAAAAALRRTTHFGFGGRNGETEE